MCRLRGSLRGARPDRPAAAALSRLPADPQGGTRARAPGGPASAKTGGVPGDCLLPNLRQDGRGIPPGASRRRAAVLPGVLRAAPNGAQPRERGKELPETEGGPPGSALQRDIASPASDIVNLRPPGAEVELKSRHSRLPSRTWRRSSARRIGWNLRGLSGLISTPGADLPICRPWPWRGGQAGAGLARRVASRHEA